MCAATDSGNVSRFTSEPDLQGLFKNAPIGIFTTTPDGRIITANAALAAMFGYESSEELIASNTDIATQAYADPADREAFKRLLEAQGHVSNHECRFRRQDGTEAWGSLHVSAKPDEHGQIVAYHGFMTDSTERTQASEDLQRLEWMLSGQPLSSDEVSTEDHDQGYGDLTALNRDGIILASIGHERLKGFANDYLELLGTSSAIYEANGDYAYGIFTSGWCRMMDCASRKLCDTSDNASALCSGRWLCHESCWTDCCRRVIAERAPVDIACNGGIRMYAVPIVAGEQVVGAINFGYGDPPQDAKTLHRLAETYHLDVDDVVREAKSYDSRPPFIIELAKKRLHATARLIGTMIETKQAEKALQESEAFIRTVMDNLPIGVAVNSVDPSVDFNYMNDNFPRMYRTTREELGKLGSFWDVVYEDEGFRQELKTRVVEDCASGDLKRMIWENVPLTRDGKGPFYICAQNIPMGDTPLMVSTVWDVTERKQAEEALKKQAHDLRESQRIAHVGSWRLDVASNEVVWTDELYRMCGFDPSLPPPPYTEHMKLFTPESWERLTVALAHTRETGIPYTLELQTTPTDGSTGWMWVHGEAVVDAAGKTVELWGAAQDITDRKRVEEALRRSEEHYRITLESIGDAVVATDADGRVTTMNSVAEQLTGWPQAEAAGRPLSEVFHIINASTRQRAPNPVAKVLATGHVVGLANHTALIARDGTERQIADSAAPIRMADGEILGVVLVFRDVTEEYRQQEALRESEERFRSIFDSMTEIVVLHELVCDDNGRPANYRILDCNPAFTRITGIRHEDATGRLATDVYGSDCAPYLDAYARVALTGEPCSFITTYAPMNRHLDIHVASPGKHLFVTVTTDITDRKKAEEALRESENLLSRAQEIAHIGSWKRDLPTGRLTWSNEAHRIFGCEPQESPDTYEAFLDFVHPDDRAAVDEACSRSVREGADGYEIEHRIVRRNSGEVRHIHERCVHERDNAGTIIQSTGTAQDITERKQVETYREMGREILQILNDSGDLQESIQHILAALKTWTGVDAVGLRLQEGEDFPYFVQDGFSEDFLLTENTLLERDKDGGVCRGKDGSVCLECTCGLVISGKTDPSNPLFTPGGSCWTNDSFPLLDLPSNQDPRRHPRNNCIHQGYASVALIPIRIQDQLYAREPCIRHGFSSIAQVPVRTSDRIVGLIQLNDKRTGFFTLETIEVLEGIAAHIGSALMRKHAEEQHEELQAQLVQAQKMDAIGKLAGGVAHDFNNQLAIVLGFASLLVSRLDDPDLRHYAELIATSARRSADLTRKLLAFSRKGQFQRIPVDVHRIINDTVEMLQHSIDKRIRILRHLDAQEAQVVGDPSQLQNALLNLAVNARDAMADGGDLTFTTTVSTIDSRTIPGFDAVAGSYLVISVVDTGHGMSPEVQSHLFEPFFTTKETGKGTGMGLASVFGTVTQHQGAITVYSEVGHGSTFRLYLPLAGECGKASRSDAPAVVVQARLRILVVDDEAMIRDMMQVMLTEVGHTVETADDGRSAVDRYRNGWQDIDLVIIDMIMPGLNGHDSFRAMKAINPAIRAILASGYSLNEQSQAILAEGVLGFIQKPFSPSELVHAVECAAAL